MSNPEKLKSHIQRAIIGMTFRELKTPVTSIKAYTQILERMLLKKGEEKEASHDQ